MAKYHGLVRVLSFSGTPQTIGEAFGADWEAFFPFPQIPAMARRAPVYPSTRD